MSDADRIEQDAAEWLVRREDPTWSERDQADLDVWLDQAPANKVAFWRLEHGWDRVGRLAALRAPGARPSFAGGSKSWRPYAIAASIVATLCLATLVWPQWASSRKTYETGIGDNATVSLSDGSRVELSPTTELKADAQGEVRQVWLEAGEAYFEVAHDSARPFVVWAGSRRITVLGTKFSVRRRGDDVRVAVTEGRVRVEDLSATSSTLPEILERGDLAVALGRSTLVTQDSPQTVSDQLSWRQGVLVFDQVSLGEAAEEFNRYNQTQLKVTDADTSAIRIGGSFQARNVDAFARLLRSAYGLKVVERDGEIMISE